MQDPIETPLLLLAQVLQVADGSLLQIAGEVLEVRPRIPFEDAHDDRELAEKISGLLRQEARKPDHRPAPGSDVGHLVDHGEIVGRAVAILVEGVVEDHTEVLVAPTAQRLRIHRAHVAEPNAPAPIGPAPVELQGRLVQPQALAVAVVDAEEAEQQVAQDLRLRAGSAEVLGLL